MDLFEIKIILENLKFDLRYNWFFGYYPDLKLKEKFVFRPLKFFDPFIFLFRVFFQKEKYHSWWEQQKSYAKPR